MRLINGDCLEVMEQLADEGVRVDLILTDPPYGTIKGMKFQKRTGGFYDNGNQWDIKLPTEEMYDLSSRLLRKNGTLILFSQEPYTSELRTIKKSIMGFKYPLIWVKNNSANTLGYKKAPVNYSEDINVFRKDYDYPEKDHPIRKYSERILNHIHMNVSDFRKTKLKTKMDHFLRYDSMQFELSSENAYNEFVDFVNLENMDGFLTFKEIKEIDNEYRLNHPFIFNLKNDKAKSNLLKYNLDSYGGNSYHPTQKPVLLLEDLIKTYTNPGDLVLDFTMGSGSTGVACYNTGRDFIGIELDEEYFKVASDRIKKAMGQSKLDVFNKNKVKV